MSKKKKGKSDEEEPLNAKRKRKNSRSKRWEKGKEKKGVWVVRPGGKKVGPKHNNNDRKMGKSR